MRAHRRAATAFHYTSKCHKSGTSPTIESDAFEVLLSLAWWLFYVYGAQAFRARNETNRQTPSAQSAGRKWTKAGGNKNRFHWIFSNVLMKNLRKLRVSAEGRKWSDIFNETRPVTWQMVGRFYWTTQGTRDPRAAGCNCVGNGFGPPWRFSLVFFYSLGFPHS